MNIDEFYENFKENFLQKYSRELKTVLKAS